jgi:hypothetical protein
MDFDSPRALLLKEDSIFTQMAQATGQTNYEKLVHLAGSS